MKKILFATSALVAGAFAAPQFASAQSGSPALEVSSSNSTITMGGYARYGVGYVEGAANETFITSRYRLQIDAMSESDGGVQFGARVRIQQDNDDLADEVDPSGAAVPGSAPSGFYAQREGTGINGVRYFVRAGGLEVGVGNIIGALEAMPGQYPIDLGLTGLSYNYSAFGARADAYSSDDNGAAGHNGIEVLYSFGDFSVHASASDVNDRRAIHGAYNWTSWTFALGLQDSNAADDTEWTASAGGDIGPAFVNLTYADNGTDGDTWVLAGRFDVGASTNVEAYFADGDHAADEAYGIDFNHNLGGGTSIRGGIENTFDGETAADLGVRFDF